MMQSDNHAAYTLAYNVGSRLPNPQGLSPVDSFTAHMNGVAITVARRAERGSMPRATNIITGPSRTADVEQTIQLGAHGPRRLHVLLWGTAPQG